MARESTQKESRVAAEFLDFLETISSDYFGTYDGIRNTFTILQVLTGGAAFIVFGSLLTYWTYIAPSQNAYIKGLATLSGTFLIVMFGYFVIRIRRNRGDLDHLAFHMDELVNAQIETVIQTEVVDQTSSVDGQLVTLLRRADPALDGALEDYPNLLAFNAEVQGKKYSVKPLIYVGVPYESWWERFKDGGLRSKLEGIWMAFQSDGDVGLAYVKLLHQQLADILPQIRPRFADVYIFAKGKFSEEAVKFVEDENNWIPHWHVGGDDEELAVINLVKMEGDRTFEVVSMPWLKSLRRERLEANLEAEA